MTHFHFDYFDGDASWIDERGSHNQHLESATQTAVDALVGFLRADYSDTLGKRVWMDILDTHRQPLRRVELRLTIAPLTLT